MGLNAERMVAPGLVASLVATPEHVGAAERIAERAITLARDVRRVVPLDPRTVRRLQVIAFGPPGAVNVGSALHASLDSIYGAGVALTQLDETRDANAFDQAVRAAADADAVVFAAFAGPSSEHSTRLPDVAVQLVSRLQATERPLVVLGFGDPYGPAALGTDALMLAWQPHAASAQHAAARALAGITPIEGRLPVALGKLPAGAGEVRAARRYSLTEAQPWDVGMDSTLAPRVRRTVETAILGGAAPGAAVAVGRHGRIVLLRGYGRLDWRDGFAAVDEATIYDIASLTKVVATTTAAMLLVDDGRLDLDAPISRYLAEWSSRPERRSVTVRNLLLHDSGLPAWAPLHAEADSRAEYRARIAGLRLQSVPGERTAYSDLGFILLGLIVEEISGEPLDAFLERRVFDPLGLRETGFNPLTWAVHSGAADEGEPALLRRIAPTERSLSAPGGFVHGVVHDENARGVGGVAGHAGLFSSARDLAVLVQMLMDHGFYDGRRYIDPSTVAAFTQRFGTLSSRALGWDTPGSSTSAGEYFTASSFGHTGFTGTSIWADRERDVFVILLTNRVNPSRDNQRHNALRRMLADVVQRAIIDMPVHPRDGR
jgi:CubicO group peptidase (beta-lactamase class C family)